MQAVTETQINKKNVFPDILFPLAWHSCSGFPASCPTSQGRSPGCGAALHPRPPLRCAPTYRKQPAQTSATGACKLHLAHSLTKTMMLVMDEPKGVQAHVAGYLSLKTDAYRICNRRSVTSLAFFKGAEDRTHQQKAFCCTLPSWTRRSLATAEHVAQWIGHMVCTAVEIRVSSNQPVTIRPHRISRAVWLQSNLLLYSSVGWDCPAAGAKALCARQGGEGDFLPVPAALHIFPPQLATKQPWHPWERNTKRTSARESRNLSCKDWAAVRSRLSLQAPSAAYF